MSLTFYCFFHLDVRVNRMSAEKDENKKNIAYELFKRELFANFSIYYFPLMFLMAAVVLSVDFLKQNIATIGPFLVIIFPGIVSVVIAFLRIKFIHRVDYKPNLKNFFLFLSVVSSVFLLQAISYSIFQELDFNSVIAYSAITFSSFSLYKLLRGEVNYKTVAKILALISPIFVLEWLVFSLVLRTVYSFITLTCWLVVLIASLRVVLKGGE